MKKYLQLLRISNYLKNGYIFMPAFFSGRLLEQSVFINSCIAFAAFSLMASAIYILNDLMDIEEDKLHPEKKFRPIPSGLISKTQAYLLMGLLAMASLGIAYYLEASLTYIIGAYLLINIFYSIKLKHFAIIDIAIISIGFILRIEAGSAATGIEISKWLMMMVFLLSMFQALAKRMDDVVMNTDSQVIVRKSVDGYSLEFLRIGISILSAVLFVCYLMYITSPEIEARLGNGAYYTALPVLLGLFRYLQLCYVHSQSASPVKILIKDHFIKFTILVWILSFAYLLKYSLP
jgi:4-hydroxybenzoate polyprenyltransferase